MGYGNCLKGVFRAFVITVIALFALAIITNFVDVSDGVKSSSLLIISLLSVVYGSIYSARKNGKNGWINGMVVALFYMIIFYLLAGIAGRGFAFNYRDALRVIIALVSGTLSGMLGINTSDWQNHILYEMSRYYSVYFERILWYNYHGNVQNGGIYMKHIKTINKTNIKNSLNKPGCKECANSCQSACKTSCTVANLACEN